MTFIQRIIEKISIVIALVTFLSGPVYHFNPFVHSINYRASSNIHTYLVPTQNIISYYNTSEQCIYYLTTPRPILQRE